MTTVTRDLRVVRKMAPRSPGLVRRFLHNKAGVTAAVFLLLLIAWAVFGPLLWTVDPNAQDLRNKLADLSGEHPLGTDSFGRDVLARLMYGGQVSLTAAVQALGLAVVIGVPLGLIAGYAKGAIDTVLSRIVDALISMPSMVLIFAIVGILGPGLTNAMLALGIVLSTEFFRTTRAATINVGSQLYVTAGRAIGASPARLLTRYVLPNALGPIFIQASFGISVAIMGEASLSFIGVGVQLPQASWGSMVREGFDVIYSSTFLVIPPALIIIATVFAFSVLGDALRDVLGRRQGGTR